MTLRLLLACDEPEGGARSLVRGKTWVEAGPGLVSSSEENGGEGKEEEEEEEATSWPGSIQASGIPASSLRWGSSTSSPHTKPTLATKKKTLCNSLFPWESVY